MPTHIVVTTDKQSMDCVSEVISNKNAHYIIAKHSNFSGEELFSFIVDISNIAIPSITALVIAIHRINKAIEIKIDGVEISGSVDSVTQALNVLTATREKYND